MTHLSISALITLKSRSAWIIYWKSLQCNEAGLQIKVCTGKLTLYYVVGTQKNRLGAQTILIWTYNEYEYELMCHIFIFEQFLEVPIAVSLSRDWRIISFSFCK